MLDIFCIMDTSEIGENCKEDDYLDSLSIIEYRSLSCVFENSKNLELDFLEDTRLYRDEVKVMLEICKDCQKTLEKKGNFGNTIYKKLEIIFEKALEKKCGIIAYCD